MAQRFPDDYHGAKTTPLSSIFHTYQAIQHDGLPRQALDERREEKTGNMSPTSA
jgi:hypothetical protein